TPYFVRNPDFLSWYERWLDELLWGYEGSWFGFGLPGREDHLPAVLCGSRADADRRGDALATLMRIPALGRETLAVVQAALRDGAPRIREQAVYLLAKHGVAAAAGDIEALVKDGDPRVRTAALDALAKLPGADWEAAARAALRDSSEPVVFRALCLLKDAG